MDTNRTTSKHDRIRVGIYASTMRISVTALAIVALMELIMLVYSFINIPLYNGFEWKYRGFYISLFAVAVICLVLNFFVKKDMERRYRWLNIANPLCAIFFFAWSLGITAGDAVIYGTVDPTVFMTFSLIVPLSFYLFPAVYAMIVIVADVVMLSVTMVVSGMLAPLINISIFAVFQLVLGISFMRLRMNLAERIVEEQENADNDILTGFPNRRVYTKDLKRLAEETVPDDLVYLSVDLNGLKDVNDRLGHEAGDRLLIGAAECIERSFGEKGKPYRIGGDEFVVLLRTGEEELKAMLADFDARTKAWSERQGMTLSTACGCARCDGETVRGVSELARVADERMYADKMAYYTRAGRDRRGAAAKA